MNTQVKNTGSPDQKEETSSRTRDGNLPVLNPLEAIRDLLHGDQVRQIESSMSQLSQDMTAQLQKMNEKFRESLCQLSTDIGEKILELNGRIDDLSQQQKMDKELLQQQLDTLRRETLDANAELQQILQQEANRLTDEVEQRHAEALLEIDKTSTLLSDRKADRQTIASLLTCMADQLQEDGKEK